MYILKIRSLGTLKVEDDYLGGQILKQWQEGKLPSVVTIGDETFLSRLLESVNKVRQEGKKLQDMTDQELLPLAKSFFSRMKAAKEVPMKDYSLNEVFPYYSSFLSHVFAVSEAISNNNSLGIWRISVSYTTAGGICLSRFSDVDQEFRALLELRDRNPDKYMKFTKPLYRKLLDGVSAS